MARKKKVKEVLPAVVSSEEESEDEKEESEDEKEEADEDEDGEEETEGSSDSEEDSESDSDGHAPPASDSPAAMPKKSAAPPAVMPTPASTPPKATSSVSKPNSPAAKRKKSAKSAAPAPTPPIADSPAAEPTSRVSKRTAEATSSVSEPIPDSPAAKTEKSAPAANPKKAAPASAPTPPSPSPSPTSKKRAAEERDPNPKEKKKAVGGEEDTKRKQRLWSDKDELTILNGMIDFKDKTGGLLPSAATFPAFHESLENNFEAQVDVRQLMYKVNKLRSKFTRKGNARVFTTPHDLESFELSRKIWGGVSEKASASGMKGGGGNLGASLSGMKLRASSPAIKGNLRSSEQQDVGEVMANVDETNVDETNYPRMMSSLRRAFPDHADRDLFRYIGHAKAKEFEGMWDKLFEETVDLCMLQHDLSIKKLNLENAQMKCLKEKEKD